MNSKTQFTNWCKEKDLRLILFDFDDTLCKTVPVFVRFLDECFDFFASRIPSFSRDQWKEKIEAINNLAFEEFGVNPNRWKYVVETATVGLNVGEEIKAQAEELLMKIYQTVPEIIPGTIETVDFIGKCGIKMAIVTHANVEWTKRKLKWLKLDNYFAMENVFIVNENQHKTKDSWQEALKYFQIKPENCMIVGDSPRADILPAEELEIKCRVLVRDPDAIRWSIHDRQVKEDTIIIKNIGDLLLVGNY